ncbi:MAG: SusC/RagA family TonB-linked outer membrane protein [Chitinophagaceae bacterium]|nr:MAG: SusC/RagA family TonB-linked outer membrane protein [Chitinophagaceae bacterium]
MNCRKLIKSIVLPVILMLWSVAAFAQTQVTGRITDANGAGIAGVTVTVKGSNTATSTNENGQYTITVPANGSTLVFSSVGYATREENLNGRATLSTSLTSTSSNLNEVVVVGYGTVRRRDVTGSVTTVTAKDFQKGTITTPDQLIVGKVAGVSVVSNGGRPGSGSTIRIRGGSSLNASNDPLIVVDGIPLGNDEVKGAPSPLSTINPNDIESFTVLKDASAAAIYGSRAANGVILITTKRGRGGDLRISFNSTNSVSAIGKTIPVLTGDEFRSVVNQYGSAAQRAALGTESTDWQSQIYQKGFASDNTIAITGGLKKLPYRVSIGYLNQTGILRTDKLQRTSLALSLSPTFLNNHLTVNLNLKGSLQESRYANTGAIGGAFNYDPTKPVYDPGNKYFGGFWEWTDANGGRTNNSSDNPVGLLENTNNIQKPQRGIGNLQLDYKFHFLPELRANLNLGFDVSKNEGEIFVPEYAHHSWSTVPRARGSFSPEKQTRQNTVGEFYLNYLKDISTISTRVDLTAGYSYNNFQATYYNYQSSNAAKDTLFGNAPLFESNTPENTLISYFSRLNMTVLDRYVLTASLRRDGSSRFTENNRWGLFPALAFAWNVKREGFMTNSNTFSELKLRVGYGVTGQQEGIGNYDYLARYGQGDTYFRYPFGNSYVLTLGPSGFNENLKWEETSTYNAAVDFGFFKGRLGGSVDFYIKKTSDLLNSVPQAAGTNFSAYVLANVGTMENRGVELNLNGQPIRTSAFTWDVNFNATYNKNEITNLTVRPQDPTYPGLPNGGGAGVNGFLRLHQVGYPRASFNLYKQVYDANGKPIENLFEDRNRDGIINDQDRYIAHSPDPNWFFGLSNNFNLGKWNAGFVLRANLNNYVYNNVYSNHGRLNQVIGNAVAGNASANYLETGFRGGDDKQLLSDYYLQNASFLRMDNLYLGYNFGKIYNGKANLRLGATVQNVFTVTNYKGLDPEVGGGIDYSLYPRPRIYSLSIGLDF